MQPLPYLTHGMPGTGGTLRTTDDDFFVDEVPAYLPSGEGDHIFIRIEKRGLTTAAAARAIAMQLGVSDRDVGWAGMKDRHAVTIQWLSLPPPVKPEQALALDLPQLRVLEVKRHPHKLRTGHVRSNLFRLRIRGLADASAAADTATGVMASLARPPGALNWYGEQRFGFHGDNAEQGRKLLAGGVSSGRRDHKRDRLMISALQSQLFNRWLQLRLERGLHHRALVGDVLHKVGGGMFHCTDAEVDNQRLAAGEIVITGPMFGHHMKAAAPATAAAELEAEVLREANLAADSFAAVARLAEGTRRDATLIVQDVAVTVLDDTSIEVGFRLPAGAYATTVIREVTKADTEAEGS
jgi:tRNA pseudouridine13 synthase